MSLERLETVKSARKDQRPCGKCGQAISAGDAYRWWGGRFTGKKVRCMKPDCTPEDWEREGNPLMAEFMQAEDLAGKAMDAALAARDAMQSVYDQLRDRLDQWPENMQSTDAYAAVEASADAIGDWIDAAEEAASALEDTPELDLG